MKIYQMFVIFNQMTTKLFEFLFDGNIAELFHFSSLNYKRSSRIKNIQLLFLFTHKLY